MLQIKHGRKKGKTQEVKKGRKLKIDKKGTRSQKRQYVKRANENWESLK